MANPYNYVGWGVFTGSIKQYKMNHVKKWTLPWFNKPDDSLEYVVDEDEHLISKQKKVLGVQ